MKIKISQLVVVILINCSLFTFNCTSRQEKMTNEFTRFLTEYESKVIPLSRQVNLVYFEASITGSDSLYKKSEDCSLN